MREYNSADKRMLRSRTGFGIVAAVLLAIALILTGAKVGFGAGQDRANTEHLDKRRVFDEADMLSDEQEKQLQAKIEKAEKQIHADIVIVTMYESIAEKYPDLYYGRSDETGAYKGIKRYAESYWDTNGFGWNAPGDVGNGIIMVDNLYRESNGYVYNWVCGSGNLRFSIGDTSCENLSQTFTDRLPSGDPLTDMSLMQTASMANLNPEYNKIYFNALMAFVDDCTGVANTINGRIGWKAFTPAGIASVIGSNIVMLIIVIIIIGVLLARMAYYSSADHVTGHAQKKKGSAEAKGKSKGKTYLGVAVGYIIIIVAVILTDSIVVGIGCALLYFAILSRVNSGDKKEKNGQEKVVSSSKGFSYKEDLPTENLEITQANQLVNSYTSKVVHVSSSSSGGGGGHSGGGGGHSGGGGGHSGGGSHR